MRKKTPDPELAELEKLGLSNTLLTIQKLKRAQELLVLLARDASRALRLRGVVVRRKVLYEQPLGCLLLATAWSDGGAHSTMPRWLYTAMSDGHARLTAGVCRECGCTDTMACTGGCSWANREHTLCSRCIGRPITLAKRKKAA